MMTKHKSIDGGLPEDNSGLRSPINHDPDYRGKSSSSATIDLWMLNLDQPQGRLDCLEASLTAEEISRASKFVLNLHKRRFIAAHGLLREILALYLAVSPAEPVFACGPHGKPALAPSWSGKRVHFNLSHSNELGLCAISWNLEVGVDIEQVRPLEDMYAIAGAVFSSKETAYLKSLAPSARTTPFFRIWVEKEAYLKAVGRGMSFPPHLVEVPHQPQEGRSEVVVPEGSSELSGFHVMELTPARGYVAAVAAKDGDWKIQFRHLP